MSAGSESSDWFLSASDRGNASTEIDAELRPAAWTLGNRVEPLIHGADYFSRLTACVSALRPGDQLFVTDWRGDDDELLRSEGPRLGDLLTTASRRGVKIRGLLWRSHPQALGFNQAEQGDLARIVNEAGGRCSWTRGCAARDLTIRSSFCCAPTTVGATKSSAQGLRPATRALWLWTIRVRAGRRPFPPLGLVALRNRS